MKFKAAIVAIATVLVGSSVMADQKEGNACAAKLSADGKAIYAASMANKPTPSNYQRIVEDQTTSLVAARRIEVGSAAMRNGMAAGDCVKSTLK
ncbi:MAG: hypothetical protein A3D94_06440 [Alphaproteobacteria bacterium RIFCSPHIGHO2_12_FULL_66_14]|jgi:hypothetical protein|nr:MAG: hypothetical protein A3D94_06440 [Alphaproteobacteria bacterium RIFCSPHIGHO2_12_FULL_66_14]